jgi:glycosyltransferase involved in cell wall biosynthesis
MHPGVAVLIPVYNSPDRLELVLTGYCRQKFRDFSLFVADDGSGPEVRSLVHTFASRAPYPIQYTFHPDEGFRRARILNRAVRETGSGYLIFADADCIPHENFVAAHCERRASRTVLCGRRVNLGRRESARLTPEDVLAGKLERLTAGRVFDALIRRKGHWDEGLLLRNRRLHGWVNYKKPTLLGCNFSLEKSLLEEINGFNEDFVGYGGEDTELELRLARAGAQFRWVRHLAIQYHLFHPERKGNRSNAAVLERTRAANGAVCRNGLRKI